MPKEHDKELKKLSSEYEFYEIDLKNYEQIEKLVKKSCYQTWWNLCSCK